MQIMDYLDNMEEEYHKSYPDDPCPMDGGYKASFERFVIESLRAEWGMLKFPTRIPRIFETYDFSVLKQHIRVIRAIRVQ